MLQKPEVIALFDKYKVLTPRELHSRYEIYLEQYCKTVNVEAKLTAKIGQDRPSCRRRCATRRSWRTTANAVKAAGLDGRHRACSSR